MTDPAPPSLSLVVACYEMRRELPRTLHSLSAAYQRGVDEADYEILLIDNGSRVPPTLTDFPQLRARLEIISNPTASKSPVGALNRGLAMARGQWIGVLVDGARMASPGLLEAAMRASRLHPRAILYTQSLTLGTGNQWQLVHGGYGQDQEDDLLESIDWPRDGYRLFEISTWPGPETGERRWIEPFYESNALFMPRRLWDEVGGYDEAFQSPGGGLASADLLARACALPNTQLVVITGEATFHQVHTESASTASGDAANALKRYFREYHRIRKRPPRPLDVPYWTFGTARDPAPPTIPGAHGADLRPRYLELLKDALLNQHYLELEGDWLDLVAPDPARGGGSPEARSKPSRRLAQTRALGLPAAAGEVPRAYTMIGRRRLDDLHRCAEALLDEGIPGDFAECGVWRGGACIFLAGLLEAHQVTDRRLWVADSFAGIPPPRPGIDDELELTSQDAAALAIDLDTVRSNFARFGLLGDRVRFLPGLFHETLPGAPIERLALLRLDGDLYSSTMDTLESLYPRVSPGGFVIVDDATAAPQSGRAMEAFREAHSITAPLRKVDWTAVCWRKP